MLNRIITGSILSLLILVILFYLPLFYAAVIFSLFSLIGFYEWLKVSKKTRVSIYLYLLLMIFLMSLLLFYHNHQIVVVSAYLSLSIWFLISIDMFFGSKIYKKILDYQSSLIGLYMIINAWFLIISMGSTSTASVIEDNTYLLFSVNNSNIHLYLLFLISIITITDTSGYFSGKLFGNTKLCQTISPNKTIVGLFGSILIPILIFSLLYMFMFTSPLIIEDLLFMLLCCVYCTFGDLFMSIFKRHFNVKDTGNLLPGHGGVLDRLDSYLPTIAIFQIWLFL